MVLAAFFRWLRPGGSAWMADLVSHEVPAVDRLMWGRYGDYLEGAGGAAYRDRVLDYVAREDTPAPLSERYRDHCAFRQTEIGLKHENETEAFLVTLYGTSYMPRRADWEEQSDDKSQASAGPPIPAPAPRPAEAIRPS